MTVIGERVPRADGQAKVSGEAVYGVDHEEPGMIWGALLRSPVSSGTITRLDTAPALAMPGVHAVITADDIPDRLWGRALEDMPVLARGKVRFIGEPIAAVAADDPDIAEAAALAVEVEYEELPAIFDAREAMQAGAFDAIPIRFHSSDIGWILFHAIRHAEDSVRPAQARSA